MEAGTTLHYITSLTVAGQAISCVESYDSIVERMRDAEFRMHADSEEAGGMHWAGPIELTVQGPEGKPLRGAFALHAISCVIEMAEEHWTPVVVNG